tara:strand:+ start:219 stop:623 length:405 start_codon:yes stop_codon:yes gene_type:complete
MQQILNNKKTITFHRNLNATKGNAWSVKNPDINQGKPQQVGWVIAENVTIKQPSGKKFNDCLAGGNRSVFAWFKTKTISYYSPDYVRDWDYPEYPRRIRFNPKHGDAWFHIDGKRVDSLRWVCCSPDGECWGIE